MRKGAATREAIVGRALEQAVSVGLEGLSLGPLADSLELSKSGLFAHFKSKEALQLAVLEEAIARFRTRVVEPSLAEPRGRRRMEALVRRWFDWMGIQRQLKVAGIFARLNHRDGKSRYLTDIPLTLGYACAAAARYPELQRLASWLDDTILPRLR